MTEDETPAPITGQKRAWEPGAPPPDGAPPAEEPTEVESTPAPEESSTPAAEEAAAAEAPEGAAPMAVDDAAAVPGAPPTTPANGAATSAEEQALQGEAAWLRQQHPQHVERAVMAATACRPRPNGPSGLGPGLLRALRRSAPAA